MSDPIQQGVDLGMLAAANGDPVAFDPLPTTDYGNARRLIRRDGDRLRFCMQLGEWFFWDGTRWVPDRTGQVDRMVKAAVLAIADEAKSAPQSRRQELFRWAASSQSATRLRNAKQVACTEEEVAVAVADFDRDPLLFNCSNGTLRLKPGMIEFGPHDPGDLLTRRANVRFDPEARAPLWESCLNRWLPNPAKAEYVQRAVGYSFLGEVRENVLFFPLGPGANGKSVFLETVHHIGGDYCAVAEPGLLLQHTHQQHPTGMADLMGKRFVSTVEPDPGKALAEAVVKMLTGGDTVKARRMRQDFFSFDPSWTIWMAANHRPRVKGSDDGIWRRIKLIPFDVRIPPEEQDPGLKDKLKAEAPGILNWVLDGVLAYWERGLDEPDEVRVATADYRHESDPLGLFLDECTRAGAAYSVPSADLYQAWKAWCEENGHRAGSKTAFGRAMGDAGWEKSRTGSSRFYVGLRLDTRASGLEAA